MNNPEATTYTIDKDGWLHTGDVGFVDDDDEVFIVDRVKEIIKYKGFQVLENLVLLSIIYGFVRSPLFKGFVFLCNMVLIVCPISFAYCFGCQVTCVNIDHGEY